MSKKEERYCFLVEWEDASTDTMRKFTLYFFPTDATVEMFDLKTRKVFLRRTDCDGCQLKDFFPGNIVYVLSRHLKILEYGDAQTESFLCSKHERTVVVVKPSSLHRLGDIWAVFETAGLTISNAVMLKLLPQEISEYSKSMGNTAVPSDDIASEVVSMEIMGERVVVKCRNLLSAHLPGDEPKDILGNHCFASKDKAAALELRELFFGGRRACNTARLQNTTCCIVKPHVFRAGVVHKVLQCIIAGGFGISALQLIHLDGDKAEDFLEVYRGAIPDYKNMVQKFLQGPCLVLEIYGEPAVGIPSRFKEFVGPTDPFYARRLYPDTIRAKFGQDILCNAVHCTDVPDDAETEVEFFFK